eukprot:639250_1
MAVKCVSLGTECSFVVSDDIDLKDNQSEEKKDEVENEWILKGDQQMNIKNGNDLRSKPFKMFVRNRMLFGDLEWVMFMRRNKEYSAFPLYSTSFIDSLGMRKDGTIEMSWNGIDERHYSEINNAKYLLLLNEEKAVISKEYVENNIKQDGLHVFNAKGNPVWAKVNFQIPSNEKGKRNGKEEAFTVRIYVQPKKELNFFC